MQFKLFDKFFLKLTQKKKFINLNIIYYFCVFLSLVLFLDIFYYNENLLIGSLFIIGSYTTFLLIKNLFIKKILTNLFHFHQNYKLKKIIILKYKKYFFKLIYIYFIGFLKFKYKLLYLNFKNLILKLSLKLKSINYLKIFIKLYTQNLWFFYFTSEKTLRIQLTLQQFK